MLIVAQIFYPVKGLYLKIGKHPIDKDSACVIMEKVRQGIYCDR